ncbi:MAG: hypothetical protein ACYSUY_16495 [Planctomycetota bacterium]
MNIEQGISNDEVRFFTSLCYVQNDTPVVCKNNKETPFSARG